MSRTPAEAALEVFARGGARVVDPSVLIPARLALELSGEELRPRLCLFAGPDGEEMALRPDLTLPLALERVAALHSGSVSPARFAYAARAFRMPHEAGAPFEFLQVGFERFGLPRGPDEDADAVLTVWQGLAQMGVVPDSVRLGDVTLFSALARGLGLPEAQIARMERAFRAGLSAQAVLAPALPSALTHDLRGLGGLPEAQALARLEAHWAGQGLEPIGRRDAGDVLEGLREREDAAALGPLPDAARERLGALLALDVTLEGLDGALAGLGFSAQVRAGWAAVVARLRQEAPELVGRARFSARLGRRFRYYDGITFDMVSEALPQGQALASGGRYDGLVGALGGPEVRETAIGAVIRPERVARVLGGETASVPGRSGEAARAAPEASDRLMLAIPSKGRLKEQCEEAFAARGLVLSRPDGERSYRARLTGPQGLDVDVLLLSSGEIADRLTRGTLQAGVTGQDLLQEAADPEVSPARVLARLGFGEARVVVAVPAFWLDVDTLADLETAGRRLRERQGRRLVLATKYPALTRRHLARAGVTEYRIVDSAGATEAAPASGSADLIVDITTTGATLKANQLRILSDGELLDSQAALAFSTAAQWSVQAREALSALAEQFGLDAGDAITSSARTLSGIDKATS